MKDKYISIIMKNIAAVILVGMIAVIFFSAIWPRLFYFIAREELSAYICNSMSETAVRISYMLSGHRRTFDLGDNEAFFDSVSRYYYVCDASAEASDHVSDQECLNELSAFLSPSNGWTKLNGAIHADNYSLLITSDGTVIGYQGYEDMAEQFYQSNAHRKIMEKYAEEPPAEGDTQMINPYYPSIEITLNHVNTEFICCAKWFRKSGITFCLVSLMPVCDFQTQLTALDSISVTDYAFFCDDTLLFENKAGSDLPIIFPSNNYTRNMQYETTRNVSTDHITFSVLCSYPSEQFYLAANVIWKELIYPFIGFFRLLQVCVFILILILTLVFTFLFRHTLLRLKRINEEMQEIRNGNFEVCLTDSGKDEIGDIVHTINEMNASIRNTLEAKIQSEKEKNRLQYSLLISSMDPHFIYNTLDTITFLAAMNKTQDIITVNNALIGTLKDRIKMKSLRVSDTVRNEREVLRQYMIIEDYLYSEPITYTFEVSDEDLELRIPKNILQPLVENSIKHGLMPNKSADRKSVIHGEIRVSINRAAGKAGNSPLLLLQVSDNGIGMTNAAKEKYQSAAEFSRMDPDHIGLTNIYLRLQYLFSDNFTFQILDNPGGGTIIQIQIPYNL